MLKNRVFLATKLLINVLFSKSLFLDKSKKQPILQLLLEVHGTDLFKFCLLSKISKWILSFLHDYGLVLSATILSFYHFLAQIFDKSLQNQYANPPLFHFPAQIRRKKLLIRVLSALFCVVPKMLPSSFA